MRPIIWIAGIVGLYWVPVVMGVEFSWQAFATSLTGGMLWGALTYSDVNRP